MTVRAPEAPLENYANNSSPPLTWGDARDLAVLSGTEHRTRRYLRRSGLWPLTELERLSKCGRCRRSPVVAVRYFGGVAGLAGVVSCGSVWVCPVCSAKIAARRRLEVGAAVAAWQARGEAVAMSTLTMRHRKGQGLIGLWNALQAAWKAVTGGAPWVRSRGRYGIAGFIRLVEVTIGRNGWHVHIHVLLFLPGSTTAGDLVQLHGWMFDRWRRALTRRGHSAVAAAQDSHLIDGPAAAALADYFGKSVDTGTAVPDAVAAEFTAGHTKAVRSAIGTEPPFSLLDRIFLDGDAEALDLWHEWEHGSHGRRQLTWSGGLRELLGLRDADQSDEEIAAEEVGSTDDDLVYVTEDGWKRLLAQPILIPRLLDAVEAGGLVGCRKFLDSNGVEYLVRAA